MTILDLLVGLSLMAVAAGGIFAGFKGGLTALTAAQQFAGEQQNARVVLDWMTRRVRMAGYGYSGVPFVVATQNEIVFYANSDDSDLTVECHRIYLNQGVVFANVTKLPTQCTTPGAGQPLTANVEVKNLTVTALSLRYFDGSPGAGAELTPPLGAVELPEIRRIAITIGVHGLQSAGVLSMSTQVTIR